MAYADLVTVLPGEDEERLRDAAAGVRAHCRWHLAPSTTETLTVDVDDPGRILDLPTLHVTGITEVRVDGVPITDYTWSARGQLRREQPWPAGFRRVEVDLTHGYDECPREVARIVRALAEQSTRPAGARQLQLGSFSAAFGGAESGTVTPTVHAETALNAYRAPGRP